MLATKVNAMAKFDPKNHDLTPSEAKFLTELSKFSSKEIRGQIEQSANEITKSRANIDDAKATIVKRIDSALAEAGKAEKKHGDLKKKLAQMETLFAKIEKMAPAEGNAMIKTLERLKKDAAKSQSSMASCLGKATSEFGCAGSAYSPYIKWTGLSSRLVPSQPKLVLLSP